jgi:hypothetical protein
MDKQGNTGLGVFLNWTPEGKWKAEGPRECFSQARRARPVVCMDIGFTFFVLGMGRTGVGSILSINSTQYHRVASSPVREALFSR